jgi:uncharacterized membrane protein
MHYLAALLIGVIAGCRTFTAPAVVSWAASLGVLKLDGSWLAFMGSRITAWIFTALVIVETRFDLLPTSASRKTPPQFAGRIVSGALCCATVGASGGSWAIGMVAGIVGTILGTLVSARMRERLARAFHNDRPAGLVEDVIAIGGAALIVAAL